MKMFWISQFALVVGTIISGLVFFVLPTILVNSFSLIFDGKRVGSILHYVFTLTGLAVSGAVFVYLSSQELRPYWLGAMGYMIGFAFGRLILRS